MVAQASLQVTPASPTQDLVLDLLQIHAPVSVEQIS